MLPAFSSTCFSSLLLMVALCVLQTAHKPPWPAEQQECLGMVNPQKLRNGRSGCLPLSALLNGPASLSFLLIHQQYFSVSDILGTACTCSVSLCRNVLGFAPSRQPFCGWPPMAGSFQPSASCLAALASTRQAIPFVCERTKGASLGLRFYV